MASQSKAASKSTPLGSRQATRSTCRRRMSKALSVTSPVTRLLGFWASSLNYGNGAGATPTSSGWVEDTFDCVWTLLNGCERQQGGAIVAAFKHYWLPTWSSALYGSAMMVRYNADVNTPTLRNVFGVPDYKELRAGANLVWTPFTGFDIGAEFMYTRGITDKPFGLANDLVSPLSACRGSSRPRTSTKVVCAFSAPS